MSSFRPANSAKLYASPEDVKTVGYRSLSLPGHAARGQLRKSHSLRASSGGAGGTASFKPGGPGQPLANGGPNLTAVQPNGLAAAAANGSNQYAQPLKNARSHSTAGIVRERKKKSAVSGSSSASNLAAAAGERDVFFEALAWQVYVRWSWFSSNSDLESRKRY